MKNYLIKDLAILEKVLKTLGFSENQVLQQTKKLVSLILLKIATEALSEKGYKAPNGELDLEQINVFLEKNYTQEEIKQIIKKTTKGLLSAYFTEILKNTPEEKIKEIKKIIESESN